MRHTLVRLFTTRGPRAALLAAGALAAALPSSRAHAESSEATEAGLVAAVGGGSGGDVGSLGDLSYAVDFEVPAYHGVEPRVGLAYSSSNPKFGQAGVQAGAGWRVRGFSRISRAAKGGGEPLPGYGGNELRVDGAPLIACDDISAARKRSSASCSSGGTHAARFEDYRRYNQWNGGGGWTVFETDGTRLVYKPSSGPAREWLLEKIKDTSGNEVTYSYRYAEGVAYLSKIEFGPYNLSYTYAKAPSPYNFSFLHGGAVRSMRDRLSSVRLSHDSKNRTIRSWRLSYEREYLTQVELLDARNQRVWRERFDYPALDEPAPWTSALAARTVELASRTRTIRKNSEMRPPPFIRPGGVLIDRDYDGEDEWYGVPGGRTIFPVRLGDPAERSTFVAADGIFYEAKEDWLRMRSVRGGDGTWRFQQYGAPWQWNNVKGGVWLSPTDVDGDNTNEIFVTKKGGAFVGLMNDPGGLAHALRHKVSNDPAKTFALGGVRYMSDLNGDGRTDFITSASDSSKLSSWKKTVRRVYLSKGDGLHRVNDFNLEGGVGANLSDNEPEVMADLDGDGAAELISLDHYGTNSTMRVYAVGALGYQARARQIASITLDVNERKYYEEMHPTLTPADLNGDGRTDLLVSTSWIIGEGTLNEKGYGRVRILLSDGRSLRPAGTLSGRRAVGAGDYNGDGCTDPLLADYGLKSSTAHTRKWTYKIYLRQSQCAGGDAALLSEVKTRLGGELRAGYASSRQMRASGDELLPTRLWTVTELERRDGRGSAYKDFYEYEGGRWDYGERRFLGFRKRTHTHASSPGYDGRARTITYYSQERPSLGRVTKRVVRSSKGDILHRVEHTYSKGQGLPYRATLDVSETTTWLEGGSVTTRQTFHHDVHGNRTLTVDEGATHVKNDSRRIEVDYVKNLDEYIVSTPRRTRIRQTTSPSSAIVRQESVAYDQSISSTKPNWTRAPSRGLATHRAITTGNQTRMIERLAYDKRGNVIEQRDALGHKTIHEYLYGRFLKKTIDAEGHITRADWGGCAQPISETDAAGRETTYVYDAACRLIKETAPTGLVTTYSYAHTGDAQKQYVATERAAVSWGKLPASKRVERVDGLGRTWRVEGSGSGSLKSQRVYTCTRYTASGEVRATTTPQIGSCSTQEIKRKYDGLGRLIQLTYPDNKRETRAYKKSAAGALAVESTDAAGKRALAVTDARGNLVESVLGYGSKKAAKTRSVYDDRDLLTSVIGPHGERWSYSYDPLGRRKVAVDPEVGKSTFKYDAEGRLLESVDARGYRIERTLDKLGRITKEAAFEPKSKGGRRVEITRRSWGPIELLSESKEHAYGSNPNRVEIAYGYAKDGRLEKKTWRIDGKTHAIHYTHNQDGSLRWVRYPDDTSVGSSSDPYRYDAAGRLVSVPGFISSTTYSPWGGIKERRYFNGVATKRGYNTKRGFLTSLDHLKGKTGLAKMRYAHDGAGRIASTKGSNSMRAFAYSYDALGRLTKADRIGTTTSDESFSYDKGGRIVSSTRGGTYHYAGSAQAPHRVDKGSERFAIRYDAAGNRIEVKVGGVVEQKINYDAYARPRKITDERGEVTRFIYGPDGKRIKKERAGEVWIYLDGAEKRPSGQWAKYPAAGTVWVGKKNAGKGLLLADHLGGPIVEADSKGKSKRETVYRPYGKPKYTSGESEETTGYIGEKYDQGSGLSYLNARYYDPKLGLFIQPDTPDPIEPGVGTNRYAYSGGDPINRLDPSGRSFFDRVKGFFGGSDSAPSASSQGLRWGGGEHRGGLVTLSDLNSHCTPENPLGQRYEQHMRGDGSVVTALDGSQVAPAVDQRVIDQFHVAAGGALGILAEGVGPGRVRQAAAQIAPSSRTGRAARRVADWLQGMGNRRRPRVAAALETPSGSIVVGTSVSRNRAGALQSRRASLHPSVQDSLRSGPITCQTGGCAEPRAISRALERGLDPRGGSISPVQVWSRGHGAHGQTVAPCPSCSKLLSDFNIGYRPD